MRVYLIFMQELIIGLGSNLGDRRKNIEKAIALIGERVGRVVAVSSMVETELGKGTLLKAIFQHDNLDRPMMGDIAGVIILTAAANENIHFVYTHKTESGEYVFDTKEIKEALDGISMNQSQVIRYLKEMIIENLIEIHYSN